jgi:adenylate kinase
LYRREDDQPETVRARLQTYQTQTEPLIRYYTDANLLVRVPGDGTVEDVSQAALLAAKAARQARS